MLKNAFIGAAFATGLVAASSAWSDESHNGARHMHDHGSDFAAMHAAVCKDRYAGEVGRLAYLEARLGLNDAQQPLFATWKNVVLHDAEAHASECASMKPPEGRPDAIARLSHEESMLQVRLASLQAELPPLTALYQSLTPEQKMAFDHEGMHHEHDHDRPMMEHGRPMDRDHDGAPHRDGDGA